MTDSPLNGAALRKVFELESRKGCADRAVIGGLDAFVERWAGGLPSPTLLRQLRRLTRPRYAELNPTQRRQWLEGVLAFLAEAERQPVKPAGKASPVKTGSAKTPLRPKPGPPATGQGFDAPVTSMKGISTAQAAKFARLGVRTIRDLLFLFPNRHIDYSQRKTISQLRQGQEETIVANVWQAHEIRLGTRPGTEAIVGDETGNIRVIWFNNPYVARSLNTNFPVVISGRVGEFNGRLVFENPEWELLTGDGELIHTARLVPVYPLTAGLYPRQMRRLMKAVVDRWAGAFEDFLPDEIRKRCQLKALPDAVAQAHFPVDDNEKDRARLRLAFDELFVLQLGVLARKRDWQAEMGSPFKIEPGSLTGFLKSLPFELTAAQRKALREITADLARPQPMSRLLQGDVGSGKTIVATVALLTAAANGFQGALMAPTEILAEQHLATLRGIFGRAGQEQALTDYVYTYAGLLPRPVTVALLIGDVSGPTKKDVQRRIRAGEIDIIVGTHTLIQKDVGFKALGLAVVDEQHRFGVAQRSGLRQKGYNPHLLVMTATPIPRTLALTLYGDLDLSVIDELPPGRQVIKSKWLNPAQRESAYAFMRRQVAAGRQAFIICPLVEESEAIQARAAVAEHERLGREVFPDLRLGLVHGRMSAKDKEAEMRRFRAGELDILVSTPVVEVGIDVPNAAVMLVEGADRFGLSQLHQFRGRVGRGTEQSYFMLLAEDPSEVSRQRLDIIEKVQDGFKLAEEDLKLRGPGEFFGVRQSGMPDLRMARLSDTPLLETARREALELFKIDPSLSHPEHKRLGLEVARVWHKEAELS